MLKGKHIVLGISGGIAAYKAASLVRLLVKNGAEVQVVITPSGKEFITPLTLSTLSGKPVISEFFTANTGEWHSHVELGLWADLMVIAPATASTIAKMATGVADNMLITTYLSAKEDVMIAPAMDLDMWKHFTTQNNISTLKKHGVLIIEPSEGYLASGLSGKGRMAEPETILQEIISYFTRKNDFRGKRFLVTAGPTFENIDPVRFIGNYSSGKMGFSIAEELASRGAEVTVVSGPVNIELNNPFIKRINVRSAEEMLRASEEIFPAADCAIFAAAVADYAPEEAATSKIKRENKDELIIKLKKNPDIAATLSHRKGKCITVGFALETDNEIENAKGKLKKKNLDLIVMNSMKDPEAGFMKDTNKITILDCHGDIYSYEAKSKREVATDIADRISAEFKYSSGEYV